VTALPIYLDYNASTPPDDKVVEAVVACMRDTYANATSSHPPGKNALRCIEGARDTVGWLLGCPASWVTFTSGATEANNLAIRGLWEGTRADNQLRDTIVIGATEHAAVLEVASALETQGARVLRAPVDRYGVIIGDVLRELVDDRTLLVSVMAANNETGTIAPLAEVVATAKAAGAYVHSDATQYVGRLPFDTSTLGLDLVTISGHKLHGPKGVGALAVARGVPLAPQTHGGSHERGRRAGTLNTPGIAGLGVAAEVATARFLDADMIRSLRDRLHAGLSDRLAGVSLNGHPFARLPNTLNIRFAGADAEAVIASLDRVACSAGSACHAGSLAPSHVLLEMGLGRIEAHESIRLSLGRTTTVLEVDTAIEDLVRAVNRVREMEGSPASPDRISA
jgi:cysteine desulfurase